MSKLPINELLSILVNAPDNQLDATMTMKVKELLSVHTTELLEGLIYIRDECVYSSLASAFTIQLLTILIDDLKNTLNILLHV